jgi:hypothetical protein
MSAHPCPTLGDGKLANGERPGDRYTHFSSAISPLAAVVVALAAEVAGGFGRDGSVTMRSSR